MKIMPTLNFNNPAIKHAVAKVKANKNISFKVQLNNTVDYISNETNGILDLASKVVPTPFSVNDDKAKVVEKDYILNDFTGESIIHKKKTYAKEKYYQVTDSILNTIINGTAAQSKVLAYIINHLEWNSNIVEIDYAEMHNLIKVNLRVITSAITYFCDNNIICRTDIKNIIVINHNLMFYGSIETFYKNYRLLCRNKPVIKGRKVILNK